MDDCNDSIKRVLKLLDDLQAHSDRLTNDFNNFLEKQFESIKDRIYTNEKKISQLFSRGSDLSGGQQDVNMSPDVSDRVTALEDALN